MIGVSNKWPHDKQSHLTQITMFLNHIVTVTNPKSIPTLTTAE